MEVGRGRMEEELDLGHSSSLGGFWWGFALGAVSVLLSGMEMGSSLSSLYLSFVSLLLLAILFSQKS